MEQEDIRLLVDWFEQNKDHKLNFLEKEAIKIAVKKASTVGDLLKTALDLLKKSKRQPVRIRTGCCAFSGINRLKRSRWQGRSHISPGRLHLSAAA